MEFEKNEDGTDKLDEQGNPIPVKVIDDKKEKESAEEKEKLVAEIKELRAKNGLMKDLLDKKKDNPPEPKKPETEDDKIALAIEKALKDKEALSAQANKKAAFKKFVAENKEFSPDNDPTGLKMDALQKKFDSFNTENISEVDEFLSVIGDARTLLSGNDKPTEASDGKNPHSNPPKSPNNPPTKPDNELTPKELKLAEQTGRTKEQLLKIKFKYPSFFREIMEQVRD